MDEIGWWIFGVGILLVFFALGGTRLMHTAEHGCPRDPEETARAKADIERIGGVDEAKQVTLVFAVLGFLAIVIGLVIVRFG